MGWWLLLIVALVVLIVLEGKRQEKRYGRARGASLMRTGMLELQRHLQPDRQVEVLLERHEEAAVSPSGDPPSPEDDSGQFRPDA